MVKLYTFFPGFYTPGKQESAVAAQGSKFPAIFQMFEKRPASCYIYPMTVTQTVEVTADRRITPEIPPQIPMGQSTFTSANAPGEKDPDTVEEALQMLAEQAANPNRKPISLLFGKHKGIFGGDGVAYQRAIRDEWD